MFDGQVVEAGSRTARKAVVSGLARLALGSTRDVVMIDSAASLTPQASTDPALVDACYRWTGWIPARRGATASTFACAPSGSRCGGDVEEMTGRTVTCDGAWLA